MNTAMLVGAFFTVLVTPMAAFTEVKCAITHLGLVIMVIGALFAHLTPTPLDLPIAAFVGAMLVGAMFSRNARMGVIPRTRRGDGVITTLAYGVTALVVARMPVEARNLLLEWSVGVGMAVCLVALAQAQNQSWARRIGGAKEKTDGAWGTIGNPGLLGGYLCLLLPVSVWFAMSGIYWIVPVVLFSMTLFVTGSRAGMLGMIVTLVWAGVTYSVWGVLPILAGIACGAFWSQRLFDRTPVKNVAEDRAFLWGYIASQIARKPIFGWGPNTLIAPVPDQRAEIHDTAHNVVLEIAHHAGLVGLGAYLWVWGTALLGIHIPAVSVGLASYAVWLMWMWDALGAANVAWSYLGMIG